MSERRGSSEEYVERWNVHQRLQHFLLMLSVCVLVLTGFPIKYADAPWALLVVRLFGGFENLFHTHLAGAVLLFVVAVYHVVYLLFAWRRHGWSWDMVPGLKDIRDALQHGLFLLGLAKERPKFGRYSYLEKFEYLAVFWGLVVMGGSGLVLWFPGVAVNWLPRWVIDALRVVHSNEAFVAILALVFGHFFAVHFNPAVFPQNPVWFTGKIPLRLMAEEHPLELRRLQEQGVVKAEVQHRESRWSYSIPLIVVELILYLTIMGALLYVFVPLLLA